MRRYLFILFLLCIVTSLKAQIYTPSGVIQGSSGNNYVGIGTATPAVKLEVNAAASNTEIARFAGTISARGLRLSSNTVGGTNEVGFNFNAPGAGGAGEISFSTLGNRAITIDSYQNVGIGTTSPNNKLELYGISGNIAGPHIRLTTNVDTYPIFQLLGWSHDDIELRFDNYFNGTNHISSDVGSNFRMIKYQDKIWWDYESGIAQGSNITWDHGLILDLTNGNVGIGTTIPGATLDVNGSAIIGNNAGSSYLLVGNNFYSSSSGALNPGVYVYKSATTAYGLKLQYTGSEYGTMIFGPNQANRFIGFGKIGAVLDDDDVIEYMRIDLDNGYIGIGTSSPGAKLDIESSSGDLLHVNGTGSANSVVRFQDDGTEAGAIYTLNGATDLHLRGAGGVFVDGGGGTNGDVFVASNGKVGIGTTNPQNLLDVKGIIRGQEIRATLDNWPDYVFDDGHKMMSLSQLEKYIKQNNKLPEVPSISEVKSDGVNLGEMDALLLKKIEELTLYVIEQNRKNEIQSQEIEALKNEVDELKK